MTAPSKSKVVLIAADIADYLGELEADYKIAHDLAYEPVRRNLERTSGGDPSDPTADTAVAREELKRHLHHVGVRLQSVRVQVLEARNNLEAALHATDEPKTGPREAAQFPGVITEAERDVIKLERERRLNHELARGKCTA